MEAIESLRNLPGVRRVFAFAINAGLLMANVEIKAEEGVITVEDIENAGMVEPRVFEVLPALFIKKGLKVEDEDNLAEDIKNIVFHGERPETFREMKYKRWL